MNYYYPTIPEALEIVALCHNSIPGRDFEMDVVHNGHCYKVIKFVKQDGFYPYGIRLSDYMGNELDQTFFVQRFTFAEFILN